MAGPAPLVLLVSLGGGKAKGLPWGGLMARCPPGGACCSFGRQPFVSFSLCQRKYHSPASPRALGCWIWRCSPHRLLFPFDPRAAGAEGPSLGLGNLRGSST